MVKIFLGIILLTVWCSLVSDCANAVIGDTTDDKIFQVQGQSTAVNATLDEIKSFRLLTLTSLGRFFKILRGDASGYFTRSQNTLRISRQNLFSTAVDFPYHHLSDATRQSLAKRLASIMTTCIDPTVDYLQNDSMFIYFNFAKSTSSPIETALEGFLTQLNELSDAVKATTDSDCLIKEDIKSRLLTAEYNNLTTAINACTRNSSASNRGPISEFMRLQLTALTFITRLNLDVNICANGNRKEECVANFLKEYCEEDSCKVCSTM